MEKMKDAKLKERFIELRATGISYSKIAAELHVSKSTLIEWSKQLVHEIGNLRSIELDGLYRKAYVAKESRIKALGTQVERLMVELEKRDLSAVSTERLFDLFLKYSCSLREEETQLKFSEEGLPPLDLRHVWEA